MWGFFQKKAPEHERQEKTPSEYDSFLGRYFGCLGLGMLVLLCLIAPYSAWWIHSSGDAAVERVVEAQAKGDFALFGSGVSQDFVDYKLRLYAAVKPEIIAIGSSRVMQFRGAWFIKPFLNMGGVAGNLAVLKSTLDAVLAISRPDAVIIGIDFWWFLPQWEADPFKIIPPAGDSYNYGLETLKKPWSWFLEGKISFAELAAPVLGAFGKGFRADRYGIMAQRTNDGFGPDGSWYHTAEITGRKPPFDFQFRDTLSQIEHGIKAFYHASEDQKGPALPHVNAFAEIYCRLKSRGIQTFVFIPPFAEKVFRELANHKKEYAHLFGLRDMLMERGIEVMDFSDPRVLSASDCEFVDGFHGGEVVYARILRRMADHWPKLMAYVNIDRLDAVIKDWRDNALVPDDRLTSSPEVDFMGFGCKKGKYVAPPEPEQPKRKPAPVKRKKR